MNPLPESVLAPTIQAQIDAIDAAKAALKNAVTDVQASCEHRVVSEMPYRSGQYLGSTPAHRICNHCRIIEEGSHWSGGATWSRHDYAKPVLGNEDGRMVLPITSDDFYKLRISI